MLVVLLTNQKDYVLRGVVSQVSQGGWAGFHRKASCGLSILFESRYINSIPLGPPYDLADKSLCDKLPIGVFSCPADTLISDDIYFKIRKACNQISRQYNARSPFD